MGAYSSDLLNTSLYPPPLSSTSRGSLCIIPDSAGLSLMRGIYKQRIYFGQHTVDAQLCETGVGGAAVAVARLTGGVAQNSCARPVRSVARRIGRTEQRQGLHAEQCRQVHRAGVSADEQMRAARQRDEF